MNIFIATASAVIATWVTLSELIYDPRGDREDAYLAVGSLLTLIGVAALGAWAIISNLPVA
jgi:hypothetical protein